jgi:plasmid maintenance system antidote protein VapI
MSIKLGAFFRQTPQFWFNIQTTCDFRQLMKKSGKITAQVKADYLELAA